MFQHNSPSQGYLSYTTPTALFRATPFCYVFSLSLVAYKYYFLNLIRIEERLSYK